MTDAAQNNPVAPALANPHIPLGGDTHSAPYDRSRTPSPDVAPLLIPGGSEEEGLTAAEDAPSIGKLVKDMLGRGCNSFVAGTNVLLANGSVKPIQDIRAGDKILSTDPKTGKKTVEPVVAAFAGTSYDHLVQITVNAPGAHTGTIIATEHHLFYNPTTHTWTRADRLTPGQPLQEPNGTTAHVAATVIAFGHPQVHDLTIATTHTYYVVAGLTPVLVHNCQSIRPDEGPAGGSTAAAARYARDLLGNDAGRSHATYIGGINSETGEVYVGCSSNPAGCAEDDIVRQGGNIFTKAFGWRGAGTDKSWTEIPVCRLCQGKYDPSQFPSDISYEPGGPWGK